MLNRRLLLSLVIALSFSTLAAADSVRMNATTHFATGIDSHYSTDAHSSLGSLETPSPSPATSSNLYGMNLAVSNGTRLSSSGALHNNIKYRTPGWATGSGHGTTAPEPTGLMLISTGLIGIAGLVRRRLKRN